MNALTVKDLCAGYGAAPVLDRLSFSLEPGLMLGVLGANGSGKTTLLKSLCGILPHTGSCLLDGKELSKLPPRKAAQLCSYIPQRSGITIDLPVLDVVLMGFNARLGLLEHPTAAMRQQAVRALADVGLSGREEASYLALSEGQRQLCILARTLVSDGSLLLLDEPESALDLRFRHRLMAHVRRWVQQRDGMAILCLHDPLLALNACDRLLLLRDGRSLGLLSPKEDEPARMEQLLSGLYGPVSLHEIRDRSGQRQLVMLKEQEDDA